jgi:hypothetical protein
VLGKSRLLVRKVEVESDDNTACGALDLFDE